ncbi:large subunit ribosomal protein L18 [Prosthecobacter debontii]|uniref:Large ribosomal subunit protein uL18 n=1 Tax=Prosthecobacter debontii TaxID=48467 RepID=A0A1T4YY74_9BACT|nr:50S ribosomal protein L18 [Prosthecobacter debontii]SKB06251.1 large subunit ribosomal protein L18 [Prosthecobacter debontii]
MAVKNRKLTRTRVHARIRKTLSGTPQRPRLAVYFSNSNVYAQLIDDVAGKTIVSASTKEKGFGESRANVATAIKVGQTIAERALGANITAVVFDRGGFTYHGKVKALADAAREKGLKF